jgi:DNA gyrase/topoisomerase IV subunit B
MGKQKYTTEKILSVEYVDSDEPLIDITVEEDESYSADGGYISHNCSQSVPCRDAQKHAFLPLRGKVINVRDASIQKVLANEEIQSLMNSIGLRYGVKPVKSDLRYGNIVILTDSDYDGYSIRALLLNFFQKYFPELFEMGVVSILEAPLYEVIRNKRSTFLYNLEEYEKYVSEQTDKNFTTKYFKGLAGINKNGWKKMLGKPKLITVKNTVDCEARLDLCFGAKNTNLRKEWINE